MWKFVPVIFVLISSSVDAQQPHVDTLFKKLDSNSDGKLTKTEVSTSQRYARQFPRWDVDGDGKVSKPDIVTFRAKFGIAADGSRLAKNTDGTEKRELEIPKVSELIRVDKQTRLTRSVAANSQFILKTSKHPVDGNSYFILTDHQDQKYLKPLHQLAEYRNARIVSVDDFATLHENKQAMTDLRRQLVKGKAKFVAIAPRLDSFRENMLLGLWELLSTLDPDPQVDCFPGLLIASNPDSFQRLIQQSISHRSIPNHQLKPFAINQVQSSRETRSLQKSGILRQHFRLANLETPIVAIYGRSATDAPRLTGDKTWNLTQESKRKFIDELPAQAEQELLRSNLVVMHGHGIPGMSCSLDINGLPSDLKGKIVMTGSCFSAAPRRSDLAAMRQAPGGYELEGRESFILRAVDNGAIVAFGHQRLSSGFPHLFPVLENWLKGKSVGEAYQQLINALINLNDTKSGDFVISKDQKKSRRLPQNRFLYVIIGDPALKPLERHAALTDVEQSNH